MDTVPEHFARRIVAMYQAQGAEWLQRLPAIIAECTERWSLEVLPPFAPLSYNYVAPAVQGDGSAVVLKVGMPHPELLTEMAALRLYDGRGIVALLHSDRELGAMVLERLSPGVPLADHPDDEQSMIIAAEVMRQLWQPVPAEHPFPHVADWAAGLGDLRQQFGGTTGPLPSRLVETAETLFRELIGSMAEPMLLHGDLHHWNIVTAERQPWLALDPKGVVGEPAYEVGALLRNPIPYFLAKPNPAGLLARRVDLLSELLGFDRQRIVAWALAQAVLAAWWSLDDNGEGADAWIACAELFAGMHR